MNARPNPGAEFLDAVQNGLLTEKGLLVAWKRIGLDFKAVIPFEGLDDRDCRLEVVASPKGAIAGNVSILWRGERVDGVDLDGPSHTNLRGQRIGTPHRQKFDRRGRKETEPVDLGGSGITEVHSALLWLLKDLGIQWQSRWQDPPLQSSLGRPRRPGRQRRQRRR